MATKKPTVDEFFSDPKYAEDKNFTVAVFERYLADKANAPDDKRPKEEAGLFSGFPFLGDR